MAFFRNGIKVGDKPMICKHCGRSYSSKKYTSKYCKDPECIRDRNKKRTAKHQCPVCNKMFIAGRMQHYCSKECKSIGIKQKMNASYKKG